MAEIYKTLFDNSISAMLAAIEIYNKPNFPHREQTFAILGINAWELLLKAQILHLNSDDLTSLYIMTGDGSFKTNRSGNCLTIEIIGAINKLNLHPTVATNIKQLVEIRDTAIHYFHEESIAYLIYTLGVATLRNYQRLVQDWFATNLSKYKFYIMPLGFDFDFRTFRLLDLDTKPEIISNLIRSAIASQDEVEGTDSYNFMCEIKTSIVSTKKATDDTDFTTGIDPSASNDTVIVTRTQSLTDRYPYSYTQLVQLVKQAKPRANNKHVNQVIRAFNLKNNETYAAYNFRNKELENKYKSTGVLSGGTPSIYNQNAVRFVIEHIEEYPQSEAIRPVEVSRPTKNT